MTTTELELEQEQQAAVPPSMQTLQFLFGRHIAHGISAIARLGVADHLSKQPLPVEALAAKVGAHAPSLYRVMRMLASFGVVAEHPDKQFAATPVSETLRSDNPTTLRYFATMQGDFWSARAMEKLPYTIQTGIDGIRASFGRDVFDLMSEHPEEATTFQRAMTSFSIVAGEAVVNSYDFSGVRRLADVGGGYGTLLTAILKHNRHMQGVLYDLPEVAETPGAHREIAPVADRTVIQTGSFFERVPAGCDAYILKHIIHDWDDDRCRTILRLIREQLPPNGRVLLCEMVVPEEPGVHMSKLLDIEMLAHCVGGKERTRTEFSALAASAGLRLANIIPTQSPFCILELRLA